MNSKKSSSIEEYKLATQFETLRSQLLKEENQAMLDLALAHWALPSDRGLPLVFLGRRLGDLLATPFSELLATPGIGHRKISSLVMLLSRAGESQCGCQAPAAPEVPATSAADGQPPTAEPTNVSEAMWVEWCNTVRGHGVAGVPLGRLAPSLQALPTVIWGTPLGYYADRSLSQIRQLKAHGEKRVRVVLEVFSIVHRALAQAQVKGHLHVKLVSVFAQPAEHWLASSLELHGMPAEQEVLDLIARPLVDQIRIDIGQSVAHLAATRLGLEGAPQSVRRQAQEMDLTRARVYQLLEDCSKVMRVRWPEGEWMLDALQQKLHREGGSGRVLRLLETIADVFYHRHGQSINGGLGPNRFQAEPALSQ